MPYTLIQLVSEQTMPNVLAALALEPERMVLLHTPRTDPHAHWINHALRQAGLSFEVELRPLSAAPDIMETGSRVRSTCQEVEATGATPVVNITGGTKLMSIGSFAATVKNAWPAVYVDTENRRFLQAGSVVLPGPLCDGWAALDRAERRLSVEVVAAAHGCDHLSSGKDTTPFLELAEYLRSHPDEESACHAALKDLKLRGKTPDLLSTLDSPLPPLPPRVAELAAGAKLIEHRGDSWHLACPKRAVLERSMTEKVPLKDYYSAIGSTQFAHGFLCGAWWEICVWEAARRSGAFRDLRWSVRFGSDTDHLEEDIVGIAGLNLAVFSCKRGGDKGRLIRSLEEFSAAATGLGGSFADKYFCVAKPIKKSVFSSLEREAGRTRIRLIGPSGRLSPAVFARSALRP